MQGLMARDGRPKKQQLLYRTTRPEMHMALPVDGHQCTVPKYHRSRHAENARSSKAEKRQSFFFHSAYNRLGRHGCHVIHLSRSRSVARMVAVIYSPISRTPSTSSSSASLSGAPLQHRCQPGRTASV